MNSMVMNRIMSASSQDLTDIIINLNNDDELDVNLKKFQSKVVISYLSRKSFMDIFNSLKLDNTKVEMF